MPENKFDFDPVNSNLNIGIEVEYPAVGDGEYLVSRGKGTSELQSNISSWPLSGTPVYDGTVGLEIVSRTMQLEDASSWYKSVIEHVEEEHHTRYQPVGLMDRGSTAGLHIHLSSLSRSQARELYEMSREPWMRVLFCSSIANQSDGRSSWPVFRGGSYCRMNCGTGHYDCVNNRGDGHYEWRLPEPMVPEHIDILVTFLRLFEQDTELAVEYAHELLDDADERITSIQRAKAVGMDLDSMHSVYRDAPENGDRSFYETLSNDFRYPEIYTVEYEDDTYYAFESDITTTVNVMGVEFNPQDDILYADGLEVVEDEELFSNIQQAFNQRGEEERETDATRELKKLVKK